LLKRREKRRYISVMHGCSASEASAAIEKRLQELYGTIALERASLKVVRPGEGVSVLRCSLGSEEKVLVAIALASRPVTTLDMSSSAKRLKRRLTKVNTALLAEKSRG
jgi:RNase P/RNase MRP subunit POP5